MVNQLKKQQHYGTLTSREDESLVFIARRASGFFLLEMSLGTFMLTLGLFTLILLDTYILGQILALAFFLLASALIVRSCLNQHYDGIFVTTQRLIVKEQELFGSSETEVPYEFIIDVIPDNRGLLNVIFQMGSIFIESGTPQDQVGFKYVRHPKAVVEQIQTARKDYLPLHLRAINAASH
jgi:hypothetical protein